MPRRLFHDLDLTPLVGVLPALFLAVAVSVSAHAGEPSTLLDPPPADCSQQCELVVSIEKDAIFVGGRQVTDASLAVVLREEFEATSARWVVIRAHPDLTYGEFMPVLEAIGKAGLMDKVLIIGEDAE